LKTSSNTIQDRWVNNTSYHIYFRACDLVQAVHNAPRPFGLDKQTLIKICFLSLCKSLEGFDYNITVIGDRLSDEMIAFFRRYTSDVILGEYGNDASLRECLGRAYRLPDETWVYLCEDDYLHSPEAFIWIDDLIINRKMYLQDKALLRQARYLRVDLAGKPLVIHPPDYPDRYKRKYMQFALVFLSTYCHWRQVSNTTFTFMAQAKTFRAYRKILDKSTHGAADGYLSRNMYARTTFRGRALCLSPIPGVSTHMHDGVMTPLVNWDEVYQSYREQLGGL
jgi:hypothetical protein